MNKIKLSVIILSALWSVEGFASVQSGNGNLVEPIKVAYFGLETSQEFEQKIKPVFYKNVRHCKSCEIENYTPYSAEGVVVKDKFQDAIRKIPSQVKIIFVNFNEVLSRNNKDLQRELLKKTDEGVLLVGAAGSPAEGLPSAPLSKTLLGSLNKIAIVGDMGAKDRLHPASAFYGPELLLAVRPPKDLLEKGLGPVIFSARWASELKNKVQKDWYAYFDDVKIRSRKLWMDVSDFF